MDDGESLGGGGELKSPGKVGEGKTKSRGSGGEPWKVVGEVKSLGGGGETKSQGVGDDAVEKGKEVSGKGEGETHCGGKPKSQWEMGKKDVVKLGKMSGSGWMDVDGEEKWEKRKEVVAGEMGKQEEEDGKEADGKGEGKTHCGGEPKSQWEMGKKKDVVKLKKWSGSGWMDKDGEEKWEKRKEVVKMESVVAGEMGKKEEEESKEANGKGEGKTHCGGEPESQWETKKKDVVNAESVVTGEVTMENVWERKERERENVFVKNWEATGLREGSEYRKLPLLQGKLLRSADGKVWYMGDEFDLYDVEKDGNCMFRAVSLAVWGTEERHVALREMVVKKLMEMIEAGAVVDEVVKCTVSEMSGDSRWFSESMEKCSAALESMVEKDGVWVGEECLNVITQLMKVSVVVIMVDSEKGVAYRMDGKPMAEWNGSVASRELYLRYKDGNHYQLLVPKKKERVNWEAEKQCDVESVENEKSCLWVPKETEVKASGNESSIVMEQKENGYVTWSEVKCKSLQKSASGSNKKGKGNKKKGLLLERKEAEWVEVKKGGLVNQLKVFEFPVCNKFQALKEERDDYGQQMEVKSSVEKRRWKGKVVKGMKNLPDWNRWDVLQEVERKKKNKKRKPKGQVRKAIRDGPEEVIGENSERKSEMNENDEKNEAKKEGISAKVVKVNDEMKMKQRLYEESRVGGNGVGESGSTPKKNVGRPAKRGRKSENSTAHMQGRTTPRKYRVTPSKDKKKLEHVNLEKYPEREAEKIKVEVRKRRLDFGENGESAGESHRLDKGNINEPYVYGNVSANVNKQVRLGFRVGIGRVVYFAGGRGYARRFRFGKRYRDKDVDGRLEDVREKKAFWKARYGTYVHMVEEEKQKCGAFSGESLGELESIQRGHFDRVVSLKKKLRRVNADEENLEGKAEALKLIRFDLRVAKNDWICAGERIKLKKKAEEKKREKDEKRRVELIRKKSKELKACGSRPKTMDQERIFSGDFRTN